MTRSLIKTVARLVKWRAVGLATLAIVAAGVSFAQAPATEKKPGQAQKPSAAEEKLPKAEAVLDKLVEASGGEAAINRIRTRVSKGTYEQGPAKANITMYEAAPNKSLQIIELPEGLKIEQGTNGEVYWTQSPMGVQIADKEEAALAARQGDIHLPATWRRHYKSAETAGIETVGSSPAYKLIMTPEEGPPELWYVDQKSNLLVRWDMPAGAGMGNISIYFEDHRKVDDVMVPFRQRAAGLMPLVVTLSSVEHNVDIPKERFELPEAVKEALKDAGKAPALPGHPPQPPKPDRPDKPEKPGNP